MKDNLYLKVFKKVALSFDNSWEFNAESFDWNPGVFLAGAAAVYKKTNNEEILDYLKGWCGRHLDEASRQRTVNSSAPLIMTADLYEITGNEEYKKVCEDAAKWLVDEAPLTVDGGLEHTVTEDANFHDQMWADTLFMAVLFIAKWGRITNNKKYMDFAAKQLIIHHKMLYDKSSGLYFHGWNGAEKNHMSEARWARANAWVILATGLILDEMKCDFEGREFVLKLLVEQTKSLEKHQHENGGYSTVLDHHQSYCEASATAGISAGILFGIEHGFLPQRFLPVAEKAAEYVRSVIDKDGSVNCVSTGTPVMPKIEDYFSIKTGSALYGQGLALFMLSYENIR